MTEITCNLEIQKRDRDFIKNLKADAEGYILKALQVGDGQA
jgi:hypothetical protein